jgi:hypothetical protein
LSVPFVVPDDASYDANAPMVSWVVDFDDLKIEDIEFLHESAYALSEGRWPAEPTPKPSWPWEPSTVEDMHEWCDDMGIPRVRVPEAFNRLYKLAEGDVWTSSPDTSPWLVYWMGPDDPDENWRARALAPNGHPLFMVGVMGYGVASYAFGIVSKQPGYAVVFQAGWPTGYAGDGALDLARCAHLIDEWNVTSPDLPASQQGTAMLALFSDMRGVCQLLEHRDQDAIPDSGDSVGNWDRAFGDEWQPLLREDNTAEQLHRLGAGAKNSASLLAQLLSSLKSFKA